VESEMVGFNKRDSMASAGKAMVHLPGPQSVKLQGTVAPAPLDSFREGNDLDEAEDSDEARILLMK